MINVIDNALPEWLFKRLEDVTKNKMNLGVTQTAFDSKDNQFGDVHYSFSMLVNATAAHSETFYHSFLSFSNDYCEEGSKLQRVRIGVIPRDIKPIINQPHVDDIRFPHKVGLLYLDDCDGDTYIYKNQYNYRFQAGDDLTGKLFDYLDLMGWGFEKNSDGTFKDFEILERVTPKRNRLVIFDGSHFHSSSTPTTQQMRWAINYNFT